jgi:hypothetical protein
MGVGIVHWKLNRKSDLLNERCCYCLLAEYSLFIILKWDHTETCSHAYVRWMRWRPFRLSHSNTNCIRMARYVPHLHRCRRLKPKKGILVYWLSPHKLITFSRNFSDSYMNQFNTKHLIRTLVPVNMEFLVMRWAYFNNKLNKLRGLSPWTNYTDRATTFCRRS